MLKLILPAAITLLISTQSALAVVSPINDGVIKCTNPEVYGAEYQVRWGYRNPESTPITTLIGDNNRFTGTPSIDMGQPETFEPGRIVNIFRTAIAPGQTFVWRLGSKTATATIPATERLRECLP